MSSKSQSTGKKTKGKTQAKKPPKKTPRLSVAFDVEPTGTPDPSDPVGPEAAAEAGAGDAVVADAPVGEAPLVTAAVSPEAEAASAPEVPAGTEPVNRETPAPARPRSRGGAARAGSEGKAVRTADPAVQELGGRVYVMVGEDLMPEGARVQMTIALTAMERHRWSRYAEARRMPMIDVLRERMAGVFSGEEE